MLGVRPACAGRPADGRWSASGARVVGDSIDCTERAGRGERVDASWRCSGAHCTPQPRIRRVGAGAERDGARRDSADRTGFAHTEGLENELGWLLGWLAMCAVHRPCAACRSARSLSYV
eukprot:4114943-Prymnesium_polylepis.2